MGTVEQLLYGEKRIVEFMCSWVRGGLIITGKGYLSKNYFAFYSSLFKTKLSLPLSSVKCIKRHTTAGFAENGITFVKQNGEKFVFISIMNRNRVHALVVGAKKGVDFDNLTTEELILKAREIKESIKGNSVEYAEFIADSSSFILDSQRSVVSMSDFDPNRMSDFSDSSDSCITSGTKNSEKNQKKRHSDENIKNVETASLKKNTNDKSFVRTHVRTRSKSITENPSANDGSACASQYTLTRGHSVAADLHSVSFAEDRRRDNIDFNDVNAVRQPNGSPAMSNVSESTAKEILFPQLQPEPFPTEIKEITSATFPISAKQFAEKIFYDKTCWLEFLKIRKFFEIDLGDWNQESSNQPLKRTLLAKAIFTHPLIGTKTINATQNHQLFSCDSKYYVSIKIITSGAPMTDAINLYLSICCSSISASSCSVSVNFGVHFVKSSMFKSIIQKQTTSETLDYYENFLDHCSTFIKHSTNAPASPTQSPTSSEPNSLSINSLSHNFETQFASLLAEKIDPLVSEMRTLQDSFNSLISVNFLLVLLLVFVSLSSLRNNSIQYNIVVVFVLLTFFIVMKVFKPKPKVTNEKPRIQEQEVLKPEPKESHVSKPAPKTLQKEETHSRKKKQRHHRPKKAKSEAGDSDNDERIKYAMTIQRRLLEEIGNDQEELFAK